MRRGDRLEPTRARDERVLHARRRRPRPHQRHRLDHAVHRRRLPSAAAACASPATRPGSSRACRRSAAGPRCASSSATCCRSGTTVPCCAASHAVVHDRQRAVAEQVDLDQPRPSTKCMSYCVTTTPFAARSSGAYVAIGSGVITTPPGCTPRWRGACSSACASRQQQPSRSGGSQSPSARSHGRRRAPRSPGSRRPPARGRRRCRCATAAACCAAPPRRAAGRAPSPLPGRPPAARRCCRSRCARRGRGRSARRRRRSVRRGAASRSRGRCRAGRCARG
jgi:hypothetical protein